MKRTIVYLHLPKCGGTSLSVALERLVGPLEVFPDRQMIGRNGGDYPGFERYLGMTARERAAVRLVRGHYGFDIVEQVAGPRCSIVVLRDPVGRAVSNVLHLMRRDPAFAALPFGAVVDAAAEPHLTNLQTRYLSGAAGPPSEDDLERALENLRRIDFVGVTDRLDAFGALVMRYLGGVAAPGFCERRNVADNRGEFDRGWLQRLEDLNRLDARLYEAAALRCATLLRTGEREPSRAECADAAMRPATQG